MRAAGLFIVAVMIATPQVASAAYRWVPNSGSNQGVLEAIIKNNSDAEFVIYCAAEVDPKFRPRVSGMMLSSRKLKSLGFNQMQIIVGGTSYPFVFSNGSYENDSLSGSVIFHSLVRALMNSKGKTFTIEVPKEGVSEEFSLADARKVLGGFRYEGSRKPRGGTLIGDCDF